MWRYDPGIYGSNMISEKLFRAVHAHDSVWYQKIKNTIMAECVL